MGSYLAFFLLLLAPTFTPAADACRRPARMALDRRIGSPIVLPTVPANPNRVVSTTASWPTHPRRLPDLTTHRGSWAVVQIRMTPTTSGARMGTLPFWSLPEQVDIDGHFRHESG